MLICVGAALTLMGVTIRKEPKKSFNDLRSECVELLSTLTRLNNELTAHTAQIVSTLLDRIEEFVDDDSQGVFSRLKRQDLENALEKLRCLVQESRERIAMMDELAAYLVKGPSSATLSHS